MSLKNKIYSNFHLSFMDKITHKKRKEILKVIDNFLNDKNLKDALDIGTTEDTENPSSNFIVRNLKNFESYKSISDQKINSNFFRKKLQKSITENFLKADLDEYKSDLVISNATIEHVGSFENQIKMCENIINLSKKYFIIITPNRYHPIDFHTKLPFLHWLPKKVHRFFLSILGFKYLSKEENLNLLSQRDFHSIMNKLNQNDFKIKNIKFLFFKSNLILIGHKN